MENHTGTIETIDPRRPLLGVGGSLRRAARRGVNLLLTWQQRARERHLLAAMDEHMLRDLGLTKADIANEMGKPFWRP